MLIRSVLAAVVLSPLGSSALASSRVQEPIQFLELGKAFAAKYCPEGSGICSLADVIDTSYATLRAGAFKVAFPVDFFGDERHEEIAAVLQATLDLQSEWVRRFAKEPATVEAANADFKLLGEWIGGWRDPDFKRVAKVEQGGSLLDLLSAEEPVREAAERLAPMLYDAETMVVTPQFINTIPIVFSPTRMDFAQWLGYAGLVTPELKDSLWNLFTIEWTQFWLRDTMIIALEYSPWTDGAKLKRGLSMNTFEQDGQRQHVVQQTAVALLTKTLNRLDVPLMDKGLAVEMTIAICGRANTMDGEGAIASTGATTAPFSRFVPGGNLNGGVLPAVPAIGFDSTRESHWRRAKPGQRYVEALKKGQSKGASRAKKDKKRPLFRMAEAHFGLASLSSNTIAVTAPFLGSLAAQRHYPEGEFLNDYRQFFRSYQVAFLDWLSKTGSEGDTPEVAEEKLLSLLSKLSLERDASLEDAVVAIYAEPLSSLDGTEGLEWRFLRWLKEQ